MRFNRSRKTEKLRRPVSNRLSVERLEDRALMAGNVTASVQRGVLVITGDASDNAITVNWVQKNTYQVLSAEANSANTTVNGVDSTTANPQTFSGVTKGIRIVMNAGNDTVTFGAPDSTAFAVAGYLQIDMGAGNDTVNLGRNETVANNVTTPENEVSIGASVSIAMGNGNDTVNITNTTIARDLVIHADVHGLVPSSLDGSDTVNFATTFTPEGGETAVFPVTVGGKATIMLGGGSDTLNMANFTAAKGLLVGDLGGNLNMNVTDSRVGGELKLQKAGGASNTINVDNVTAGTLRLNTGNGVDTITVRDSIFERLYMNTADGKDIITIGNTTVRRGGQIDGARNKARLIQEPGNNLRSVAKVRVF
jgi:hypothetical protein